MTDQIITEPITGNVSVGAIQLTVPAQTINVPITIPAITLAIPGAVDSVTGNVSLDLTTLAAAVAAILGGVTPASPVITSMSPIGASSASQTNVMLTGSGFTGTKSVTLGTSPLTFAQSVDTQITAIVHPGLTTGVFTVSNGSKSAVSSTFTVTTAPPPPPPPILYVYQNHSGTGPNGQSALWDGDFSFGSNGPIVGNDTTHPEPGHTYNLKVPGGVNGVGGGMAWMPVGSHGTGNPDGSGKGPFGFDMSPYTWMTFDIWTAFPTNTYDMLFEYLGNFPAGSADQGTGAYIDDVAKVPEVTLNSSAWSTVKLPIAAFGQLGIMGVYKFYIRDNTSNASREFYLDNVGFVAGRYSFIYNGGAPNGFNASTNTWTNDPSTLLNGWTDASTAAVNYSVAPSGLALNNKVSLNGITQPGIGTASTNCISMQINSASRTWKVQNASGFPVGTYTYFTFGALPTSGTHSYSVQFYSTSGAAIGSVVSVSQNSAFTTREWNNNGGHWTIYAIPLAAFGTLPAQIGGLSIMDTSGLATNTIYLSAPAFFT